MARSATLIVNLLTCGSVAVFVPFEEVATKSVALIKRRLGTLATKSPVMFEPCILAFMVPLATKPDWEIAQLALLLISTLTPPSTKRGIEVVPLALVCNTLTVPPVVKAVAVEKFNDTFRLLLLSPIGK